MPPSDIEQGRKATAGKELAVTAEALYLSNLLILPGVGFLALLILYLRKKQDTSPLAACHLRQTLSASIWAGILLLVLNTVIIFFGGYQAPSTWVIVIIFFTVVHASFVILGTLGLAAALAGKHYHYPVVGASCSQ